MAYVSGRLITIHGSSDYTIPLTLMGANSYHGVLSTLDKEARRDGDGILHRTAILQVPHATFTTRPLNNRELGEMFSNIRSRYTNAMEKRVRATVYITEIDDYLTQEFYVPDIDPQIDVIDGNTIKYDPVQIEFIGYGKRSASASAGGGN